jgi:hypothetical protein
VGAAGRTAILLLLLSLSQSVPASGEPVRAFPVEVQSHPISRFRIGSDEKRFGSLEFVGGLELRSTEPAFGSISGFRRAGDDGRFVAVTDTGYWLFGRVEHDAAGRPSAFSGVTMLAMADAGGSTADHKHASDAESLELDGNAATVGFERDHRIETFEVDDSGVSTGSRRIDHLVPDHELRRNAGFEAIARAPADSHLAGALIAITERSLDPDGNFFAAILEGPQKGLFRVARHGTFDVTDGVFLPDGDLLVVERSFNIAEGVKLRLRRIALNEIARDRIADGEILFTADMRHQIDNMEATDAWTDGDGHVRVALLSDDNQSFLQRNLYLEFRFADPAIHADRGVAKTRP